MASTKQTHKKRTHASKKSASKKAVAKKPASKQPASKQPASKKPASKKPASTKPASKKPASRPAKKALSRKQPAAARSADRAAVQHEYPLLADDIEMEVVGIEALGDARLLHLSLGGGRMSILFEPARDSPFTEGAITVPSARDGAAIVDAIATWLSQPAPPRPPDALDPPPPARVGMVQLQHGTDEAGFTWQRTKLCFGATEELFVIWETSGRAAWLSEKYTPARKTLLAELAFVLRDGTRARDDREVPAEDPLLLDRVPLVTSLVRVPVRPASVVGHFWRDGRYHVFERLDADTAAIVAVATDGTFERIATLPAATRYLSASGPHIVATVDVHEYETELWIVGPGETRGRRLLHDPMFQLGQMVDVVSSPDGSQIAVTGREGLTGVPRTRILAPDGTLLAETDERYPDRWENGGFVYAPPPRRFEVSATKTGAIAIVDHEQATTRVIEPGQETREILLRYESVLRGAGTIVAGTCFTLEVLGDLVLVDGVSLKTWSIMPCNAGLTIDPTFQWIAVSPYSGGLLLGRIGDRWRTGAAATESEAVVRDRLAAQIAGERFTFDGVETSVQVDDWAIRLGVTPAEIRRRLDTWGRAQLSDFHAQIDAALATWSTDAGAAVHEAARVPVSGAATAVWSTLAGRTPHDLTDRDRAGLRSTLRRLVATRYERYLQHDENVVELLGAP